MLELKIISETAVIEENVILGENVIIGENTIIKSGTKICSNCIIGANCIIGLDSYIDIGVIIRDNVKLGNSSFIGARSILGEYLLDFIERKEKSLHFLDIGNNAIIRSETIIYSSSVIGENFQTGHRVTIRECSNIASHVRIGTLSDIQGYCEIGNYVNIHSNVHIGQQSKVKDYVWIFPYVVLTNDPNPPSENLLGVLIKKFAVISTGSIILPGITIGEEALVGAGAIVTKDVLPRKIVIGNPAKDVGYTNKVKNKVTGEMVYPWKYTFNRGMPWEQIGYKEWKAAQKYEGN